MKLQIAMLCVLMFALAIQVQGQGSSDDTSGVIIHADPRLSIVTAALRSKTAGNGSGKSGIIRSGRGYRVQIYSGNDRTQAVTTKVDFMRRFPQVPTYMTYIQPQFRVKVGNFRSRGDAQKLVEQIHGLYSPLMVVPDIIVINTFKGDQ